MNRLAREQGAPTLSSHRRERTDLERQIGRIRQRLAAAWDRGRPQQTIHRLEDALRERWRLLDETRNLF